MKPIKTPQQLDMYTNRLFEIYNELENEIFKKMAELLMTDPNHDKEYVYKWYMEKMVATDIMNRETIRELSKVSGMAEEEIYAIFEELGYGTIQGIEEQLKSAKVLKTPPTPKANLNAVMAAYVDQTFLDIDNLVNSTLIYQSQKVYRDIIEKTTAQVITGNKTVNEAVTDTIIKWREKGLPSGFVDKGGKRWSATHYATTVIRNTANRAYEELRTSKMLDNDIHLVRVSEHPSARPACAKIQGGVCSLRRPGEDTEGYPSIYEFGYTEPSGIRGVNCRHILYPFVDGVNILPEKEYTVKEAEGRYELTQKQRQLERSIRKAKESLMIAEISGTEKQVNHYKQLVKNRQERIRLFVKENKLPRYYNREKVYE